MNEKNQADKKLLESLRNGDADSWTQLVEKYEGRLTHFARAKLPLDADFEDFVQETFISFIRGVHNLRSETNLENYLFTILLNKIILHYRSKKARSVCIVREVYSDESNGDTRDVLGLLPATDPTVSWYVSQNEQHERLENILATAVDKVMKKLKQSLNFKHLKVIDLIFYGQISDKNVAKLLDIENSLVRSIKFHTIKKIKKNVSKVQNIADISFSNVENVLNDIWESNRLSCPKRSTLGAFILETLESEWFDYVDFHLTTLGCHFCRASLKDLMNQQTTSERLEFRQRIMASTIGFLTKS